ncbi:MAG: holo-ACP synthase [Actinomycetia bacterium]|nr:holo-ACP synthase [Actinomycetes bacterium]
MIAGIGVDVVEVERLARALERRPRFRERVFDPEEVRYAEGPHYLGRLAARFAAKEAVVKACGGFHGSGWRDIVVYGALNRPPQVEVRGPLGAWIREQGGRLAVSLTHERTVVAAVAILERPDASG